MKLTKEDIKQYATEDEKKFLKEGGTERILQKLGSKTGDILMRLYNDSHPHGTEYDRLMKRGYNTKEEMFRKKAKARGFSDEVISFFLNNME